jgi:hypothetical protein
MGIDLNEYPARVARAAAMMLLAVRCPKQFAKIVAAHDSRPGLDERSKLVHRLPGEVRARYRTSAIAALLNPAGVAPVNPSRRATRGVGNH